MARAPIGTLCHTGVKRRPTVWTSWPRRGSWPRRRRAASAPHPETSESQGSRAALAARYRVARILDSRARMLRITPLDTNPRQCELRIEGRLVGEASLSILREE